MEEIWFSLQLIKFGVLAGIFLGLSLSLTSPFLILKKNALFPHALTHVLFFAIIFITAFCSQFSSYITYPIVLILTLLAVLGILLLNKYIKLYEDTATSIITHLALGLALIIATKTNLYNSQLLSYLFGSLITVTHKDFYESIVVLILSILFFYKFYPFWIAQITDKEIPGINFKWANFFYLVIITLQIIIGIKLMGILLVSAFFVFSGSCALRFASNFKLAILYTAILNILGIIGGTLISIFWDLPFSGSVVVFMSFYFLFLILSKFFNNRGGPK